MSKIREFLSFNNLLLLYCILFFFFVLFGYLATWCAGVGCIDNRLFDYQDEWIDQLVLS